MAAKTLLIWMILFMQAADVDYLVARGEDAFMRGDYPVAAQLFQDAAELAPNSGGLLYNAALAAFQAGQMGDAMLYALRAEKLLPDDGQLRTLLQTLRNQIYREDDFATPSLDYRLWDLSIGMQQQEVTSLGLAFWYAGFTLLAFGMWHGHRLSRWGGGIAICCALLILGAQAGSAYVGQIRPRGVVLQDAIARSGPGDSYLSLASLVAGTEILIRDERNGWIRLESRSGRHGWLPQETIAWVQKQAMND